MQTHKLVGIICEGSLIITKLAAVTELAEAQLNSANERVKWARRDEVPLAELKAIDAVRFSTENTVVNADAAVLAAAIALQAQLSAEISRLTGTKEGDHE